MQLNFAEPLHSEATPYAVALRRKWRDAIAPSSKLITEDIASPLFPASYMRAKQSGLAVINSSYRSSPSCCVAKELIHLAHGRRIGSHFLQDTTDAAQSNQLLSFYDPVVLEEAITAKSEQYSQQQPLRSKIGL